MGFSRQEHWSGLLCHPPGDLPNPGIEPGSPALQVDSLAAEISGSPLKLSVQSLNCVQLCNPMDYSMPGFPVHQQLLELAQTHVYRVGDAIQPSHPLPLLLLPPSIFPTLNLFQHIWNYSDYHFSSTYHVQGTWGVSLRCVWMYLYVGELHNVYLHPCVHTRMCCVYTCHAWVYAYL